MEAIFRREGIELNRSTVCGWHLERAALADPLLRAMHADALAQPYVCANATGVLVQDRERCRHEHFWVLMAPPLGRPHPLLPATPTPSIEAPAPRDKRAG
ncbi:MAG: transposase [Deltaproteobacteria bacterium]|nr:transposase [Deltaproteobacteria bacterium]